MILRWDQVASGSLDDNSSQDLLRKIVISINFQQIGLFYWILGLIKNVGININVGMIVNVGINNHAHICN